MPLLERLNKLKDVPFEKWPENGVKLQAVSANANGKVNSGIINGVYFYRNHKTNSFEIEK